MIGRSILGDGDHRIPDDYYATPPIAVEKLLQVHQFTGQKILEPCVGAGHILNVLKQSMPGSSFTVLDIVDRGCPGTILADFLIWDGPNDFDTIITNPPYLLASEFIRKCHAHLADGGQLAMFLKIQFLEGIKRRDLFVQIPPRYVYVFRKRISAWSAGEPINKNTGKPWASTVTFCWYVWQKGHRGDPAIRWID